MRVLELGCGTGSMWVGKGDLVKKCGKLILSDFSEGMLEQTRETLKDLKGIEYQTIDIQNIPYEEHTFDIVIANMMLYHVPDLQKGLREVRRVLKEGGRFYCATFGKNGIMPEKNMPKKLDLSSFRHNYRQCAVPRPEKICLRSLI